MRAEADAVLEAARAGTWVVHRRELAPRSEVCAAPPADLLPPVLAALRQTGIERLWSHQTEALGKVLSGRDVLVVTPTASGKSLIYNLAVLQACAAAPGSRALYLFPYKALAQDQKLAFDDLAGAFPDEGRPRAALYDGDTPAAERRRIRAAPPEVLITNPDMLHLGLLARQAEWAPFWAALRLVVVDELHVYRGVFGTHLHHIVQRLRRVAAAHGATPRFVAASATVGKPERLGRELIGVDLEVVAATGAPQSGRHVVFLQPGMDLSPYTVATRLMAAALRRGLRTITFTRARRVAELMHTWLGQEAPEIRQRIAAYRAGYLPADRRAIEARLESGDLLGVIATSALELGVDIGGLDVCILVGYPGSLISSWQRIGRVGRQGRDALAFVVGMPDALDGYMLSHPEVFFDGAFERVVFDPANPVVAASHLVCAAAELPLTPADDRYYPPAVRALVPGLLAAGRLARDEDGQRVWSLRRQPQRDVHLRSAGQPLEIRRLDTGKPLGTADAVRARLECHEGAVYLHGGRSWLVRRLDLEGRRIEVEPAFDIDYYTVPLTEKQTEILERRALTETATCRVGLGRLKVTTWFRGYARRRVLDQALLAEFPLDLPPFELETIGMWVELPPGLAPEAARRGGHFMGAIHAVEHAAIGLFPLLALCDRFDLGGISYPHHPQIGGPAFFIYDGQAGGIGLAEQGFERIAELLSRTRDLLATCACESGCPACVQSPRCGNGNRPLDKGEALHLLRVLTGAAPLPAPLPEPLPEPPVEASRVPAPSPTPLQVQEPPPALARPTAPPDLFFDLETLRSAAEVGGWQRSADMGLALAVVYDRGRDRWTVYREADVRDLVLDLLTAPRVVGFNIRRFDFVVLSGYVAADFTRVPVLDLLEDVHRVLGFRLSLAHLAEETLGIAKGGDGLQSLRWVAEGRWDLIEAYCRRDVEITARLFDHGREHGHLLFRDRSGRRLQLPVAWD